MFSSTLPVSSYVNEVCARLSEDMTSSFESQFPNFNTKPTRAHIQSACYFARQHSFRVSCASALSYEFAHEINVLARRATLLFSERRHRHCLQEVHIACVLQAAYQCKGTVLRACVLHVDAQMRSFFPTTQQQHTCSRHMSCMCACACRGKKKTSHAVTRTKT